MRTLLVFGARPNFVKIAPIHRAMAASGAFEPVLVHTGQHFDAIMSDDVIKALELPEPDMLLEVGPGTQAWQIATIMSRLEPIYDKVEPDFTLVVGDVSSTVAAALVSATREIPVAHVEAGLRSFNEGIPEERNRVLTDRMSRWLFAPDAEAAENLRAERFIPERIHLVGNVMIDSLDWVLPRIDKPEVRQKVGAPEGDFGLVTMHRVSNVDDPAVLERLMGALTEVSKELPLLFAVHPRTRQRLEAADLGGASGITLLPPLNYPDFVSLLSEARLVLTDSGGIQEEAVVLGSPCLTLREETERLSTLAGGLNQLVGTDPGRIVTAALATLDRTANGRLEPYRPPLWDGHTAERVTAILAQGIPPAAGGAPMTDRDDGG